MFKKEDIDQTVENMRAEEKKFRDEIEVAMNDISVLEFMISHKIKKEKVWSPPKRNIPALPRFTELK